MSTVVRLQTNWLQRCHEVVPIVQHRLREPMAISEWEADPRDLDRRRLWCGNRELNRQALRPQAPERCAPANFAGPARFKVDALAGFTQRKSVLIFHCIGTRIVHPRISFFKSPPVMDSPGTNIGVAVYRTDQISKYLALPPSQRADRICYPASTSGRKEFDDSTPKT